MKKNVQPSNVLELFKDYEIKESKLLKGGEESIVVGDTMVI